MTQGETIDVSKRLMCWIYKKTKTEQQPIQDPSEISDKEAAGPD